VNLQGLVPALEHDGKALYESLVLLEYLEDAFPSTNPLRSPDPHENGLVRLASAQISNVLVPSYYKLLQAQEPQQQKEAKEALIQAFKDVWDQWFVKGGEWSRGEKFGVLDCVIAPWIVRLDILVEHRDLKISELGEGLEGYVKRILERKSVKDTISEKEAYKSVYQRYLNNTAESEVAKATRKGEWLK